jgi:hypothetical protein
MCANLIFIYVNLSKLKLHSNRTSARLTSVKPLRQTLVGTHFAMAHRVGVSPTGSGVEEMIDLVLVTL